MGISSARPPSQRQLKVGEELRHSLSEIFMRGDFYNPETRQAIMVTISEVSISPDLGNATVFIMPLGGKNIDDTINSLNQFAPKVRSLIAQKVRLRRVPELYFKLDESFIRASDMNDLLNRPDVKADITKESEDEQGQAE